MLCMQIGFMSFIYNLILYYHLLSFSCIPIVFCFAVVDLLLSTINMY